MGCMSFLIAGFVALFVLLGCTWFFYVKAVRMFTAEGPVEIAAPATTEAEHSAAQIKLNAMRHAMRGGQAGTFAFSAAELNALIARDPEFASRKGRTRIAIQDSIATVDMSVSLSDVPLPRVKERWFNGSTRLGFSYDGSGFDFDPQWIEANGHHLSGGFLHSLATGFSSSFTTSFEQGMGRAGAAEAWRNVKSMRLERDQLIIETRGESGTSI
jgi:hypothetical protein